MTVPNPIAIAIATKAAIVGGVILLMQFASGMQGGVVPYHDPWFIVFVAWVAFSCITGGMPEPTNEKPDAAGRVRLSSTDGYLWAYRSMHLFAASGTSYFRNKMEFPTESPKETK